MADLATLDRANVFVLRHFIDTGRAPHYADLARAFSIAPEEGRTLLRELVDSGIPAWQHPGTDYIVSYPPFHSLPTQYRVTVDGEQKWFAQCGLEALAMRWLFPGGTVRIDAPCLDCGERLAVEMRDEQTLLVDPPAMVGYSRSVVGGAPETRAWR